MTTHIVDFIIKATYFFEPHCKDISTLEKIRFSAINQDMRAKCHELFREIRVKTMAADKAKNPTLIKQYVFEEVCAKSLYNLGHYSAPFDPDVPYWIVPNAIELAREIGLDDAKVIELSNGPKLSN